MQIVPLGDSALVLRLRQNLTEPDQTLEVVLQAIERLRAAKIPGVIEITPAFVSVGVYFDPVEVSRASGEELPNEWLTKQISVALGRKNKLPAGKKATPLIEIPICCARIFASDLPQVAEHTGFSEEEVIRLYLAGKYRVQCVGFTPSFPYLSGLNPKLATPRRATPRKQVPVGSVAIGGALTGIYPQISPGGWSIVGRTPLRMFDVARDPAALLQTGNRVRFRAITLEEFNALSTR